MDTHLSNLLDSGVVKVKKTKKKIKRSKKKHKSSLKKYKNIQNKKSVNKYISPKIKINKVDSEDNPKKPIKKTTPTTKKFIDESTKQYKKKINLTKKKQLKKKSNKNNIEMIDHLRKKGIYVSGKNPKLLKDIYMYSLDDNIRIINE